MLTKVYRKLLPYSIREAIYKLILGEVLFFFRNFSLILKSRLTYHFYWFLPKTELNKAYRFFGRHRISSYPAEYSLEYRQADIQVCDDEQWGLPFVVHHGRKLYFRKSSDHERIKSDYRDLLIEQDPRSAHRYVRSYDELADTTLLDVGAAEGIFSLDAIDFVDHVYLFECNEDWMLPLQATFAPWKHKVTTVPKFVGGASSDSHVAIDDFLRDKPHRKLFIKIDIEGAEMDALHGAMNTLTTSDALRLAICTYHRVGDPERMADLMTSLGFDFEFTDGLMYWDRKFSKGVIRGGK
jgi:hypothetical protein